MRAILATVITAAIGAFIFTGCDMLPTSAPPPIVGTPYPKSGVAMWRGNAQRTGAYDTAPVRKLNGTKWKVSEAEGMPVVANGLLYFNSGPAVEALNAENGIKVWEFKPEDYGGSSWHPAIMNSMLYTSRAGVMYAIDTASTQEKWRFAVEPVGMLTSPAVTEEAVYFGANFDEGSTFYALDLSTGKMIWRFDNENQLADYSDPVTAEGIVYFAENPPEGYVRALDAANGKERWKFKRLSGDAGFKLEQPGRALVMLAVADRSLYIRDDKQIFSVSAVSGEELWRHESFAYSPTAPAISGGVVYITHGSVLQALEAKTGQAKWAYGAKLHDAFTSSGQTSPVVAGDVVYFGVEQFGNRGRGPASESTLYAVDAATGQELWSFELGRTLQGYEPVVADGVVYVRTDDSNLTLHALR